MGPSITISWMMLPLQHLVSLGSTTLVPTIIIPLKYSLTADYRSLRSLPNFWRYNNCSICDQNFAGGHSSEFWPTTQLVGTIPTEFGNQRICITSLSSEMIWTMTQTFPAKCEITEFKFTRTAECALLNLVIAVQPVFRDDAALVRTNHRESTLQPCHPWSQNLR